MSSPDVDASAAARVEAASLAAVAAAEQALADGETAHISDEAVQRLITAGTRLYAHKVEQERRAFSPLPSPAAVTATEAVVLLSGMLRALNLSLFDLSMWMDGRADTSMHTSRDAKP
jgi:hypothetical protein